VVVRGVKVRVQRQKFVFAELQEAELVIMVALVYAVQTVAVPFVVSIVAKARSGVAAKYAVDIMG